MFKLKSQKRQVSEFQRFSQLTDEGTISHDSEMPSIIQTACSLDNSYFVLSTGQVWACGQNDSYQCTSADSDDELDHGKLKEFIHEQ